MTGLDSLWILISSILVLLLVVGMGLHGSGTVRSKNSVSMLFQTLVCIPLVIVSWLAIGHSVAFSPTAGGVIGDLSCGVWSEHHCNNTWIMFFHCMFAVTSIVVVLGAYAERLTLKSYFAIVVVWPLIVYAPVAHWVWSESGWLKEFGTNDFAGGIVVHVTAGFSALAGCLLLGRRQDYFNLRKPHSITSVYLGATFILIGWLGFNGGSSFAFNESAAKAILNTLLAGGVGTLCWILLESLHPPRRVNLIGATYGLICSLVAITPAAGLFDISQTILSSLITIPICFYSVRMMNRIFKVDDALDVFSSHGVSGLVGSSLSGVFLFGGLTNFFSAMLVGLYSFTATYLFICGFRLIFPLRMTAEQEELGQDITYHGEIILNLPKENS